MKIDSKNSYLAWANLVDLGYESLNAAFIKEQGKAKAKKELKAFLRRQADQHWLSMCRLFKKLKKLG